MTSLSFFYNFLIITTLGVFIHFVHDIFKKGFLVHVVGAINESTWEHLKLAFWPMLLSALLREFFSIEHFHNNFWFSVGVSLIVTLVAIPVLYYSLRYFTKREITWLSILIYYIAVFLGLLSERVINIFGLGNDYLGITLILSLTTAMIFFSFFPPHHFLFKDPVTKKYGDTAKHK